MTLTLTAVPIALRTCVRRVGRVSVQQEYDDYRRRSVDRSEPECEKASVRADLEVLFDKDLLSLEASDVEVVNEKAQEATHSLVSAVVHKVPLFRKGYV